MLDETKNKITRLLSILNSLDKGEICLKDLSSELGVSLRTLQRDIRTIQDADLPITDGSCAGRYCFMDGFSLKKMKITPDEAGVLVFMSEIADNLGVDFSDTFAKLRNKILTKQNSSPFYIKLLGQKMPSSPVIDILAQAIEDKEFIFLHYSGGSNRDFEVKPLKIAWYDGFWYLMAIYKEERFMKFRLEKITKAKPLGKFFKMTHDIEKVIDDSTNIFFEIKRDIDVKLKIKPEAASYFKNKKYFPLQKIEKENEDGSLLLSCKASKIEEVASEILHWLPCIKVISPKELDDLIKEKIKGY